MKSLLHAKYPEPAADFSPCIRNLPGLMYSGNRPLTVPFAAALRLANRVTAPVRRELASLPLGSAITTPPLHTETVARAAVAAVGREGLGGIFDVEGITGLAEEGRGGRGDVEV